MNEHEAEVAVWVEDAWQRHGVGGLLLREIVARVAEQGYSAAVGFVEPSNEAARRLVLRVCPKAEVRFEDGVLRIRIPLLSEVATGIEQRAGDDLGRSAADRL
jgi:GNAT superfamily N-acetyltransferase